MTSSKRFPRAIVGIFLIGCLPVLAQVTETPQTVAPGKLLFEIDGIKLSFDRAGPAGNKHTAVAVASTLVSTGLTSTVDLQAGFELFLRKTFEGGGLRDSRTGFGDLFFRTKWKFWQDETAGAALALIPYVKIPSNTDNVGNDAIEGGLIVPWEKVVGALKAGAMFRWDVIRNPNDDGYDARWQLSGFVQRNLTKSFGVYAESTFAAYSSGWNDWQGTVGVGALWWITGWLQLDYELQRGINDNATDWAHVLRVNWGW